MPSEPSAHERERVPESSDGLRLDKHSVSRLYGILEIYFVINMHIHTHTHTHTHIYTYIHTHIHTYIHTYIQTRTHTQQTYTHTHTDTNTALIHQNIVHFKQMYIDTHYLFIYYLYFMYIFIMYSSYALKLLYNLYLLSLSQFLFQFEINTLIRPHIILHLNALDFIV